MARAKKLLTGGQLAGAQEADLLRQRADHERRRVQAGSDVPFTPERNPKEHPWSEDYLEALSRPVRITVSFDNLPLAAKQMRILGDAAFNARSVLYDLNRSQQRKRLDLRFIMKQAADEISELHKTAKPESGPRARSATSRTPRRRLQS